MRLIEIDPKVTAALQRLFDLQYRVISGVKDTITITLEANNAIEAKVF